MPVKSAAARQLHLLSIPAVFSRKKSPPGAGKEKEIRLNGEPVAYTLRYSGRKSIGFLVKDGKLTVTVPKRCPLYVIEDALRKKAGWILPRLGGSAEKPPLPAEDSAWSPGKPLPYLGRKLPVLIEFSPLKTPAFEVKKDALCARLPEGTAAPARLLKTWLKAEAFTVLSEILCRHSAKTGLPFDKFAISGAKTRWGSCTSKRHIRLNWRLIHCDPEIIGYVAVHELAHTRHMNHSPRFWAEVEKWYPDYKRIRKALRETGPALFKLFADD